MPEPLLIDHDVPYPRAWGVTVDGTRYRADCWVMARGNVEPPPWIAFGLRPLPDGIALEDWASVGITQALGPIACEVTALTLTAVDAREWAGLANTEQPNRRTRRSLMRTRGGH